jgi:hypothetical protein
MFLVNYGVAISRRHEIHACFTKHSFIDKPSRPKEHIRCLHVRVVVSKLWGVGHVFLLQIRQRPVEALDCEVAAAQLIV